MKKFLQVIVPITLMISMIITLSWIVHSKVSLFVESNSWVAHSQEVIAEANSANNDLQDADAEYWFFIINGKLEHRRRHFHLQHSAHEKINILFKSTEDNLQQQENLTALNQNVLNREIFVNNLLDKKLQSTSTQEVGSEEYVKLRKNLNSSFITVVAEEKRLLEERQGIWHKAFIQLLVVLLMLAGTTCVAVSFIIGIFYSDIRRQEKMDHFLTQIKN